MKRFRSIEISDPGIFPVRLNSAVCLDRHKKKAQSGKIFVLSEGFPEGGFFDLVKMSIDTVHAAVVHDQLGRGLFTDFGNAGDIVGTVAHQRLDMDKAIRCNLILLEDIGGVIVLYDCLPLPGLGNPYAGVFRGDLQKVPVSGQERDFHSFCFPAPCQRSENVVRFKTCLFADLDSHGLQHFFDQRDLLPKLFGHRFAGALVLLVHLVAESRRVHIKCHRQIIRLLLVENFKKNVQKAVNGPCMQSGRIGQIRHAVECSVEYTVPVHKHKFFAVHQVISFRCSLCSSY